MLSGDITKVHVRRLGYASWRNDFLKEWEELASRSKEVELSRLSFYHTNPVDCVCSCPAFLYNRFMLCKHLLFCFKPVDLRSFYV